MIRERHIRPSAPFRAGLAVGTAALLALNAGCAVDADPKVSDTTICTDAGMETNPDGTTTIYTEWKSSPYGPPATSMVFSYTDGHSEHALDTTDATTAPRTLRLPEGTLHVLVTIVNADGSVAFCPSASS